VCQLSNRTNGRSIGSVSSVSVRRRLYVCTECIVVETNFLLLVIDGSFGRTGIPREFEVIAGQSRSSILVSIESARMRQSLIVTLDVSATFFNIDL